MLALFLDFRLGSVAPISGDEVVFGLLSAGEHRSDAGGYNYLFNSVSDCGLNDSSGALHCGIDDFAWRFWSFR